jgi:hypothetical protein
MNDESYTSDGPLTIDVMDPIRVALTPKKYIINVPWDSLIGGGYALHLFEKAYFGNTKWKPSDVDIFTPFISHEQNLWDILEDFLNQSDLFSSRVIHFNRNNNGLNYNWKPHKGFDPNGKIKFNNKYVQIHDTDKDEMSEDKHLNSDVDNDNETFHKSIICTATGEFALSKDDSLSIQGYLSQQIDIQNFPLNEEGKHVVKIQLVIVDMSRTKEEEEEYKQMITCHPSQSFSFRFLHLMNPDIKVVKKLRVDRSYTPIYEDIRGLLYPSIDYASILSNRQLTDFSNHKDRIEKYKARGWNVMSKAK